MQAQAIIFDLGGVILDIDYNLTRNAFENLGVKKFHDMYSQANADELFSALETGSISEDAFYKKFNKQADANLSSEEIKNAWNAILLKFRESSLKYLEEIKLKYQTFLLSNTNHIHIKAFDRIYHEKKRSMDFRNFFDKAYYSCEIGLRKPDAACYEYVLKENNLNVGATIFIDDSIQNIETAKKLGLQTILLKPGKYIENLGL